MIFKKINKLKDMTKKDSEEKDTMIDHESMEVDDTKEALESDPHTIESELESEITELRDKYLRLIAEFDNFKKRSMKERLDLMKTASQDVVMALLPVLDDFDRAKNASDNEDSDEEFSDGVNLVYTKLKNTLSNKGLKEMETNNENFDPELHEAITEIPAPDASMKGKIIDTIEKGYTLNDKIIRHAKVIVGK